MTEIEKKIRAISKEKGIIMKDLAARAGMTPQALLQNMRRENMTLSTMLRFTEALGIEPYELIATREEVEEVRNQRLARMCVTMPCPCCGEVVCMKIGVSK